MPDEEFDPEKMRACMVAAFFFATLLIAIVYIPFWTGMAG
jgi:hypothetical protein